MRSLKSSTTTTASTSTAMLVDSASAPAAAAAAAMQRSPWHSPIPYLFGGLAAMLGLIAFALLVLACSYWKLSGQLNGENNGDDLESGDDEKKGKDGKGKGRVVYEEQFVVIMPGDHKPTCLAMPVVCSSRSSANLSDQLKNESDDCKNGSNDEKEAAAAAAVDESVKEEMGLEEEVDVHRGLQSDHEEAECNDSSFNSEESHQLDLHHHHHHSQLEPAESSSSSSSP